jgi:hypothetical protein
MQLKREYFLVEFYLTWENTVDHEILLHKLDHYGIRGIANKWFKSYLNNKRQFVSIGNINSDTKQIIMGVPHSSVLGPLLFLLYINDFQNSSSVFEFHLFADDSNLFYSNHSLSDQENIVNNELLSNLIPSSLALKS